MPAQSTFCNVLIAIFTFFMLPNLSISEEIQFPSPVLIFGFPDYKGIFRAGDNAFIEIKQVRPFKTEEDKNSFNPNVYMNNTLGNSSFITGLWTDMNNWKIWFMPITVGLFNVLIVDDRFKIFDSTNRYHVSPGPIYELGGIVSFMGPIDNILAGTKVTVLIEPKDAFGNAVTSATEGQKNYNFMISSTNADGSNMNIQDVVFKGWDEFGYLYLEFMPITSGNQLIHVKHNNDSLIDSPLLLTVYPNAIDGENCLGEWPSEVKYYQLSSRMVTLIHQRDKFGNLVPGAVDFEFEIMKKGDYIPLPLTDLQCKEVTPGTQSFIFKLVAPGEFMLLASYQDKMIFNTPYDFEVYTGYIDDNKSTLIGYGFTNSYAGEVSEFNISLKDAYDNPALLDVDRVQVQIRSTSLPVRVYPKITITRDASNDIHPTGMLGYDAFGHTGITSVPSHYSLNNSTGSEITEGSDFIVEFVCEKSGMYLIHVFAGNIPLRQGIPFYKEVFAVAVNVSLSKVIKYGTNVSSHHENDIFVRLVDSYYNTVPFERMNLKLEVASLHTAHFFDFEFKEQGDGIYKGGYMALDPGAYELCVSYKGARISPFPFGVYVQSGQFFPTVRNDEVTVWEDESVGFSPLKNDKCIDGPANIVEFQKPKHGSVLQYGNVLRYTPYKGFYGNDEFFYTVTDAHVNNGSARVDIFVLTIAPQFVSSPTQLQATEDLLSPKFGGFPGFEVTYADAGENISVLISAQHGSIILSPLSMQLFDPMWNQLSVTQVDGRAGYLNLTGRLELINFALKSLKYLGDENFSGTDTIKFTTVNVNGKRDLNVPITVEPINDPPYINVPKFILLDEEKKSEGIFIFDKQQDKFNFSIGDPDHPHIPGSNESNFKVMFSVEASCGYFSAKLPAKLISTTELKLRNSKQWQPLIEFVEISRHFTVKAKGIRFRATIDDCNTLLQQLLYFDGEHGGALRLSVNDMGWYGCYPDCTDMNAMPLFTEATVSLITRSPVNALVAHSLGSVIVIESILLFSLIVTLMFSTCKCVVLLLRKKKKNQVVESQNVPLQTPHEQTPSTGSSENLTQLAENCPAPLTQSVQPSSQPVEETNVAVVATMTM